MESNHTLGKSVTTSVGELTLKRHDLVVVNLYENAVIEIDQVNELYNCLNDFMQLKPYLMLVIPGNGTTYSMEAQKYAARLEDKDVLAQAIVVDNLAQRLLANFYIKVNRPGRNVKVFSSLVVGMAWLDEFSGTSC